MLPDDITNYVKEISRMLRKQGKCFFSTFIMNYGFSGGINFPYSRGYYRLHQETNPEKAVGYNQDFLKIFFR